MAEGKICGKCNENEAKETCSECGIDICEMCSVEIALDATHPAARIKGYSKPGALTAGTVRKNVCKDCLSEVDVFE
ncbi:MAG: hypothetical protein AB1401_07725 [Thermodesulfobacteriota bacterium]|jgi:hypothetical protein